MKNILNFKELFEKRNEEILGGKADNLDLKNIADIHGIDLSDDLKLEFEIGKEVEKEHTKSPSQAIEIALDHLREDPKYYTKLIKSGIVDEPEAIAIYNKKISSN